MKNYFEALEKCIEIANITDKMPYEAFMSVMCMLFDSYHKANPNSEKPAEMAKIVASLVEQVNDELGEF